jgi:hypothetical protein
MLFKWGLKIMGMEQISVRSSFGMKNLLKRYSNSHILVLYIQMYQSTKNNKKVLKTFEPI